MIHQKIILQIFLPLLFATGSAWAVDPKEINLYVELYAGGEVYGLHTGGPLTILGNVEGKLKQLFSWPSTWSTGFGVKNYLKNRYEKVEEHYECEFKDFSENTILGTDFQLAWLALKEKPEIRKYASSIIHILNTEHRVNADLITLLKYVKDANKGSKVFITANQDICSIEKFLNTSSGKEIRLISDGIYCSKPHEEHQYFQVLKDFVNSDDLQYNNSVDQDFKRYVKNLILSVAKTEFEGLRVCQIPYPKSDDMWYTTMSSMMTDSEKKGQKIAIEVNPHQFSLGRRIFDKSILFEGSQQEGNQKVAQEFYNFGILESPEDDAILQKYDVKK